MAVGSVRLPELRQDIKVDTKDLDRAVVAARRFKNEMERNLKVDAGDQDKSFADLEKRLDRMAEGNRKLRESTDELGRSFRSQVGDIDAFASSLSKADEAMRGLRSSAAGAFDIDTSQWQAQADKVASTMRDLTTESRNLLSAQEELGDGFRKTRDDSDGMATSFNAAAAAAAALRAALAGSFDIDTDEWQAQAARVRSVIDDLTSSSRDLRTSQDEVGEGFRNARTDADAATASLQALAAAAAAARAALASSFDIDTDTWRSKADGVLATLRELSDATDDLHGRQVELGSAFRDTRTDADAAAASLTALAVAARALSDASGAFNIDTSQWMSQTEGVRARIRELMTDSDNLRISQENLGRAFRDTRDDANAATAALTALAAAARALDGAGDGFNIDTSNWMSQTDQVRDRMTELYSDTEDLIDSQKRLGSAFRDTREDANQTAAALSALAAAAAALDGAGDGFNIDTSRWMAQTDEVRDRMTELYSDTEDLIGSQQRLGESFRNTREDANATAVALRELAAAASALNGAGDGFNIDTSRWMSQTDGVRKRLAELKTETDELIAAQERLGTAFRGTRTEGDESTGAIGRLSSVVDTVTGRTDRLTRSTGASAAAMRSTVTAADLQAEALRKVKAATDALEQAEHNLAAARLREEAEALRVFAAGEKVTVAREKGGEVTDRLADLEAELAAEQAKAQPNLLRLSQLTKDIAAARIALGEANIKAAETEAKLNDVAIKHEESNRAVARAIEARTDAEQELGAILAAAIPAERQAAAARHDVASSTELVSAAEERLRAVREQLDYVTRGQTVAERELENARADGDPWRIATAEALVAQARQNVTERTREYAAAERDVTSAHREHESSLSRMRTLLGEVDTGYDRNTSALSRMAGAISSVTGFIGSMAASLGQALPQILSVTSGVAGMAAQFALWTGIIGGISYLVGGVGAAIGGLVPVVAAAIPIVGALALGFQGFGDAVGNPKTPAGIKKQQEALDKLTPAARAAAEALNRDVLPAFEGVQAAVQEALFKDTADDMSKLARLAGPLEAGMVKVADAVRRLGIDFINAVTSGVGIERINKIMDNSAELVEGLHAPLINLGDALSNVASRSELMRPMIGIFQDLINKTAEWFRTVADSGLLEEALNRLKDFLGTVEDAFFKVLESAMRFFRDATPGVDNLITQLGNIVSALLDRLGPAFGTAAGAMGEMLKQIPQSAIENFGRAADSAARGLKAIADSGVVGVLVDIAAAITAEVASRFEKFGLALKNIGEALGPIKDNGPGAATGLGAFKRELEGINGIIVPLTQPGGALNGFTVDLKNIGIESETSGQKVAAFFNDFSRNAEQASRDLDSWVADLFKAWWEDLTGELAAVGTWFSETLPDAIDTATSDSGTWLDDAAADLFTAWWDDLTGELATVGTWFSETLPNAIKTGVSAAGTWLDQTATDLFKAWWEDLTTELSAVGTWFSETLPNAIKTGVSGAGEWLATTATDIFRGWWEDLSGELAAVGTWFSETLPNAIKDGFKAALGISSPSTVFKQYGSDTMAGLLEGLQTTVETVLEFFRTLPQTIMGLLSDAGTWLVETGRSILQGLVQGITSGFESVRQFFSNLRTTISNFFSDAASWLVGAGQSIVSGLASGIQTGYQNVSTFFAGVGASIQGFFAGAESWLVGAGQSIMSGLLQGMQEIGQQIIDYVTNLVNQIMQLFQQLAQAIGGLFGGGGGAGGGGGTGPVQQAAAGGVFEYYANGGMRPQDHAAMKAMLGTPLQFNAPGGVNLPNVAGLPSLTPMSGRSAEIVPPNTWRVIGDRPAGDEAFIPINQSGRSRMLLEETASRMGYAVQKMAAGGFGNAQTNTTTGPPTDSGYTQVNNSSNSSQAAPLVAGDLVVTVPADTPVQDSMDEVLWHLRRMQRGGVHLGSRARGR